MQKSLAGCTRKPRLQQCTRNPVAGRDAEAREDAQPQAGRSESRRDAILSRQLRQERQFSQFEPLDQPLLVLWLLLQIRLPELVQPKAHR